MKEGDVNVFEGAFDAFVNELNGPIGQFLVGVVEATVIPEAQTALSEPAVRQTAYRAIGNAKPQRLTWALNPPPGPPRERTGELKNSLEAVGPLIDERGIVAYGVAFVSHKGFEYPIHLRDQGYRFLPLDDPRYVYIDVP